MVSILANKFSAACHSDRIYGTVVYLCSVGELTAFSYKKRSLQVELAYWTVNLVKVCRYIHFMD